MTVDVVNREVYRFDGFVVDAVSRSVLLDGQPVTLTPKVFEMLVAFLQRPGELLEKGELMTLLWPDSFVEEANLAQNVAVLRKALGENSRQPKYILTIPGRGYRFIGDVQKVEPANANGHPAEPPIDQAIVSPPGVRYRRHSSISAIATVAVAAILTVVGLFLFAGDSEPMVSVGRTSQLTAWSGLDFYPSISPDGRSITFSSDRSGSFEIYTRQMLQGAREIQITSDGLQNFQPVFSPDGSQIAYASKMRPGIFTIPSGGGAIRQLTTFGTQPAWSPDGSQIAFQSDPLNDLGSNVRNAMPPSTLWLVASSGGEPREITKKSEPKGGHGAPSWSPDGKRIVFDTNDWAVSELWTLSVADGSIQRVIDEPQQASEGIFSPDGTKIFYVAETGGSIHYVPVSATGKASSPTQKILDPSGTRIRQLSLDRSGTKLVYATLATSSNILLSRGDGAEIAEPSALTKHANTRTVLPAFSPDGKTIVYQAFKTGSLAHIWLMNSDGGEQRQLTSRPGFNPIWSADGQTIWFVGPEEGLPGFWSVDAASGLERKLFDFDERETFGARTSPDGKLIAFNSNRSGTPNIWIREMRADSEPRQFTFDTEFASFPAWSPDGRWLAVQVKRGENTFVGVMPAAGGEITLISDDPGQAWVNGWAGDSDRVIFAGQRKGVWNVFSVSRTTKQVKQITNFTKLNSYVRYPSASPVEEKFAYEYAETSGNVWMVELR